MEMYVLLDSYLGSGANAIVGVTFDKAIALAHMNKAGCTYKETTLKED